MKRIKMAIIGTGLAWERLHLPALRELQDMYEVVALANPTRSKLEKAADEIGLSHDNIYTDYHDLFDREDIDVMNVIVPIELNYKISKDCAKAGFNVICEKPLAPNMEQSIKFLDLQERYNVKIMIAENYRFNEENNIIKKLVEDRKIGDILYFVKNNVSNFEESMYGDTYAAKEWRQHPEFEGGAFLDGGVHEVAALRHIFGDVDSVSAYGIPQTEDYSPYAVITSIFQFKSGVVGNFNYCCKGKELQHPNIGFRIFGTEGEIYLEDKMCGIINVMYREGNRHEMIKFTPKRGFYNEFRSFYEVLVNNKENHVPPDVEFNDAKTIFSILKSIDKGKAMDVNDKLKFFTRIESQTTAK